LSFSRFLGSAAQEDPGAGIYCHAFLMEMLARFYALLPGSGGAGGDGIVGAAPAGCTAAAAQAAPTVDGGTGAAVGTMGCGGSTAVAVGTAAGARVLDQSLAFRNLSSYLKRNLSIRLDHGVLAREMGLGETRFRRVFQAATGLTVKRYIDSAVERRARELLAASDLTVKEIAGMLGFADEFYFSRFFKRKAGKAPSLYRRSQRFVAEAAEEEDAADASD
jgi:AraC-like DNA-binding protein